MAQVAILNDAFQPSRPSKHAHPSQNCKYILVGLIAVATACYLVSLSVGREPYSLHRDVREAETAIRRVAHALDECREHSGYYVANPSQCNPLANSISAGQRDGFAFRIQVANAHYSVLLTPSSRKRLVSLYIDQTGVVRLGTRSQLASAQTAPLHQSTDIHH